MPVSRDLRAEERAVGTFRGNNSRLPDLNNPQERADVYRLAYPPSGGLPSELASTVDQSLYQATGIGGTASTLNPPLSQTVEGSNLGQLQGNVGAAQAEVQKTSQPNTALRVLQEAIRAKSGAAEQGIGKSKIFEQAGVEGIGALSQSIAAQGAKMDTDFANFSNIVNQMGGTYRDMATTALNNYEMAYTQFKDESTRLQGIQDELNSRGHAFDLIAKQHANALELKQFGIDHPSISDAITAEEGGMVQNAEGKWVTPPNTVFNSPSGDTYDVAPYAVNDDGTPNMDHINAMNFAAQQMGKLETPEDITNYIQQYYPSSPITAEMVQSASAKFGIDWETILATMVAETQMGTDGSKGSQMNNFGNVGNTNQAMKDGQAVGLQSAQDGVDAVARTMSNPRYKRNQVSAGGGEGGELTDRQKLEAKNLAVEIFGKRAGADPENIGLIESQLRSGLTLDDIRDNLITSSFSGDLSGLWRDAATASVTNITGVENRQSRIDEIDRSLQAGNQQRAVELIKRAALESAPAEASKNIEGKERTVQFLNEIRDDLQTYVDGNGDTNIFTGKMEDIAAKVGTVKDAELRKIATKIETAIQTYRRNMSGTAFTETEAREYKKIFPSIDKINNFNTANIDALVETFGGDVDHFYDKRIGTEAYEELIKPSFQNQAGTVEDVEVIAPIDVDAWTSTLEGTQTADGDTLTAAEINQLIDEALQLSNLGDSQDEIMAKLNQALGY